VGRGWGGGEGWQLVVCAFIFQTGNVEHGLPVLTKYKKVAVARECR
jgi:hypothetical protein